MSAMLFGHILIIFAMLAFSGASALFIKAYSATGTKRKKAIRAGLSALGLAFAALLLTHVGLTFFGSHGLSSGFLLIEIICALALLSYRFFKIPFIGLFVAPLCTLLLIYDIFSSGRTLQSVTPPAGFLPIHIGFAILGQAFAVIIAALSAVYLQQHLALKKKELRLHRETIIPMDSLEKLLVQSLWIGFLLISMALVTGAVYVQFFSQNSYSGLNLKFTWAVIVWLYYLSVMIARSMFSLNGKRVAQFSLGGFILLAISFFGFITPNGGG